MSLYTIFSSLVLARIYRSADHSTSGLSLKIMKLIEDNGLSFQKGRGQGHDWAVVMSGVYGGVQALIERKQSAANFIHCAAHNLNLVVGDTVTCSVEIQSYIAILEVFECLITYFIY